MSNTPQDPGLRWRDRPLNKDDLEDRAEALIHGSLPARAPEDIVVAGIADDLLAEPAARRRLPRFFPLALTALVLVLGGAGVMAYQYSQRVGGMGGLAPGAGPANTPKTEDPSKPVKRGGEGARPEAKATAPAPVAGVEKQAAAPAVAPVVPTAPAIQPSSAREAPPPAASERASPKSQTSPSPTSPATEEARALDQALTLLRRHNATAALASLDSYLHRYPGGPLSLDARVGRVDALLLLNRSDEALTALEGLPLDGKRRSNELQVIRAELRARTDCASAIEDFTAALVYSRDLPLVERILHGRGTCRAQLGDKYRAAQDLRLYLERFPQGPHATEAKEWLSSYDGKTKSGR